ncbi:hypothetical protein LZ30DRAFT_729206 [Colletotrichum cereale]|nr:hypothetical protein LZ30DRAFT_729206 [Colletotrichum cereale]
MSLYCKLISPIFSISEPMIIGLKSFSGCHILAFTAAVPCSLFAKHVWDIFFTRIHPAGKRYVAIAGGISNKFKKSHSLKRLVTPRDHVSLGDTYLMDLVLPYEIAAKDATDEILLAAFVRGFFAGKVFSIERRLLQIARVTLLSYSSNLQVDPVSHGELNSSFFDVRKALGPATAVKPVWATSELSPTSLPSLNSIIFGTFQVSHVEIQDPGRFVFEHEKTESSIDFVFGRDKTQFAGVHRFSLIRNPARTREIIILYEHTACNPTINQRLKSDFLLHFHNFYAMLLLREGVAEMMKVLEKCPPRQ